MRRVWPILAAFVLVAGCYKEHDKRNAPTAKKLVAINFEESPLLNTKFGYDATGKLITAENAEVLNSIFYNGDSKAGYTIFNKPAGRNIATGNFNLSNRKNATHLEMDNIALPGYGDTTFYDYEYSTDGYLVKLKTWKATGVISVYMEYADGNMIKQISFNSSGEPVSYWIYTYSPAENKTGVNTDFTIYTNSLAGKMSKNLLVKAVQFDMAGTKQSEIQYSNVLDADGYLVKKTTSFLTKKTVLHSEYVYSM